MDVKALQRQLRDFAAARDWQPYHSPKNLAMALMVEAAELLELFQWLTITESRGFTRNPSNKERVADEIADVLLYLLQLADHTDVDVEQAATHKLRKNGEKYPAKSPKPLPAAAPSETPKVHLLVDWENVQPAGEALKELVPQGTDVWIFHSPQQKVNGASHKLVYGDRITLIPRSGAGRNALDFQLSYYVGYITARQPGASFVVVSNDQGYDSMLAHARELGFDARRCGYSKVQRTMLSLPGSANALNAGASECAPQVSALPGLVAMSIERGNLPAPAAQEQTKVLPVLAVTQSPDPDPDPRPLPAAPVAVKAKKTAAPKPMMTGTKATREDVQQCVQLLQGMHASQRPQQRDELQVLLQVQLGEQSPQSPRVAHALAQLQAQKHVAIKGNGVSYPATATHPTAAPPAATVVKKKPTPAKKLVVPAKSAPAKAVSRPSAAQIAHAVLASLKKMPKNKPTRQSGLLKFIETHAAKAADPKAMAQQIYALLEARKDVVLSPDGKIVGYPKMK